MRQRSRPAELHRRIPRLLLGLVICGWGIALLVTADLGLGPWDVLHQGLADRTGISIGRVTILVGFVVLLAWLPLRERPGLGTVCNVLLIGLVLDGALGVLETPDSLAARSLMMLAGPVLFGIGSGFYLGAGLGAGPRDGIMTGLARRGLPIAGVRTVMEVSALVAGWLLGGTVGVGTVVFAFGVGPVVHVALPRLTVTTSDAVHTSAGDADAAVAPQGSAPTG